MFEAFVIVCAATISFEIDQNSCFSLSDNWGPYKTEENCGIRVDQMTNDILHGDLNPYIFSIYQNLGIDSDLIYAEGYCEKITKDAEA